jgi:hypothetical protein
MSGRELLHAETGTSCDRVHPIKHLDRLLRVVVEMEILGVLKVVLAMFYPISCAGSHRGMKLVRVPIRVFAI